MPSMAAVSLKALARPQKTRCELLTPCPSCQQSACPEIVIRDGGWECRGFYCNILRLGHILYSAAAFSAADPREGGWFDIAEDAVVVLVAVVARVVEVEVAPLDTRAAAEGARPAKHGGRRQAALVEGCPGEGMGRGWRCRCVT